MKNTKFSIIIPAYNAEKTIISCINSALSQNYDDYEIIVVNDGSNDATADILAKEYGNNKKVTVLNQKNQGVSTARNRALKAASGDWILFLDSDDWIEPETLQNLNIIAEKSRADLIITRLVTNGKKNTCIGDLSFERNKADIVDRLIFEEGGKTGDKALNTFRFRCPGGKIVKRSLIINNQISFPEGISNFEDGLFFLDCILHSQYVLCSGYSFYNYTPPKGRRLRTNGVYNDVINENMSIFENLLSILKKHSYASRAINNAALVLLIPSLDSSLSITNTNERKIAISSLFHYYYSYCAKASFSSFGFAKKIELFLVKIHFWHILLALLRAKRLLRYRRDDNQ